MRFIIFILFFCVVRTLSRPQQEEQSNGSEESEYENYDASNSERAHPNADDGINQVSKTGAQDEDAVRNQRLLDFNANAYMQRSADRSPRVGNFENIPDYKTGANKDDVTDDSNIGDKDYQSVFKRNPALRYVGYNAEEQAGIPLQSNRDSNNYKVKSDGGLYKRTIDTTSNEADLYETDRRNTIKLDTHKKGGYVSDSRDSNEQVRFLKKYYPIPTMSRRRSNDQNIHNVNRDRRQTESNHEKHGINVSDKLSSIGEDENEEAAIRNHIKKLSDNEIQELLGSLSEDKRLLLKSIIDHHNENELINKREINKKGESIEGNAYIENESDSSKPQDEINVNSESSISLNVDTTESTKLSEQTEIIEAFSAKDNDNELEPSRKSELTNSHEDSDKVVAEPNSNSYVSNASDKEIVDSLLSKSENKRETNLVDLNRNNKCSDNSKLLKESIISNDKSYFVPQDDLTQLLDDEYQLHFENNEKKNKRDVNLDDKLYLTDDSMKSLEESFPNANYDDTGPYPGSDMVPLIRVKRKNENLVMKKRAAGVMPDAKAAYVPYRGENDDEDNDEGNEFDDDGFYDRTSNYAKLNNKPLDDDLSQTNEKSKLKNDGRLRKSSPIENLQFDSVDMKLGSDTDNILSSVEGVDENLMFSSASRSRRTSGNDENVQAEDFSSNMLNRQIINTPGKNVIGNLIKTPNYQENDAFGPLPRNYEGELGRYKRIRHVKQLPVENEPVDSNNYLNNDK